MTGDQTTEVIISMGRKGADEHARLVAEIFRFRRAILKALDADEVTDARRILLEAIQVAYY